jgi:enamine deaminase RidA (YjgF/YER057c/UK114 family)
MSDITRHSPGKLFSGAVVHGNTVYLAGQTASNYAAGVKGQTEEVLAKIDALLAQAGTDKSRILSANCWLSDIRNFEEMNEAWLAWVDKNNLPARATVEAKMARSSILVEIMVVAATK